MSKVLNYILLFILLFVLNSCHVDKKVYYKANGQLMEEYQVKWPNTKVRDGFSKIYNMDGTLVFDGFYKNNELNGIILKYFDDSSLNLKVEYSEGRLMEIFEYYDIYGNKLNYGHISKGKGQIKVYNKQGQLRSEGPIVNGYKDGRWAQYTNMGLSVYTLYSDGKGDGESSISPIF